MTNGKNNELVDIPYFPAISSTFEAAMITPIPKNIFVISVAMRASPI